MPSGKSTRQESASMFSPNRWLHCWQVRLQRDFCVITAKQRLAHAVLHVHLVRLVHLSISHGGSLMGVTRMSPFTVLAWPVCLVHYGSALARLCRGTASLMYMPDTGHDTPPTQTWTSSASSSILNDKWPCGDLCAAKPAKRRIHIAQTRVILCFHTVSSKFFSVRMMKLLMIGSSKSRTRSDARPPGMRTVAGSNLGSGNILSLRLDVESFLRPFSPYRWFK